MYKQILLAVLTAGLLACAGAGQKTGDFIDDSSISTKVKAKLFNDPVTSGWKISVTTEKGVVRLTGSVATPRERDRAAEVARSVAGVRSVRNELAIQK